MADEIAIKPKVSCPECHELQPEHKISAHIERHRPFNPPGPGTSVCPKGCGRNLIRSDMKEHVDLCDGSLPLPSKQVLGSVAPAATPPPIIKKEEPVPGKMKLKCPICGIPLKNSKALGGHMGAHRSGRGRKPAKPAAQTAEKPAKRPYRRSGKRVAPRGSRPGGSLPPPPARATKTSAGPSTAGASLREAAQKKLAAAQELILRATELENQASELEKLAKRADELL